MKGFVEFNMLKRTGDEKNMSPQLRAIRKLRCKAIMEVVLMKYTKDEINNAISDLKLKRR